MRIKVGHKIVAAVVVIEIIIMMVVFLFVNSKITDQTRDNAVKSMETIAQDRAAIIENYVLDAENYLTDYSRAGEISALLKKPYNKKRVARAQKYTEIFGSDRENLEGIYVSEWNTHVLAHTNAKVVGITTREGDSLKALQEAMLSKNGVYNAGIIISPASGQQIISIYRACFDEKGNPVGLVGGGIFSYGLVEKLNNLHINGMDQAKYCLVNMNTGEYIFHNDEEKVAAVADEEYIKQLLQDSKKEGRGDAGYITYKENNTEYIASYKIMQDRDWMFILSDSSDEIFTAVKETSIVLIIICIAALIVMIIVSFAVINICTKPLAPIERALLKLKDCDIRENREIKKYIQRKDDLGNIAVASDVLISSLKKIILTLKDCSGVLNSTSKDLQDTSANLVDCASDNVSTTEELCARLDNTGMAVDNIYQQMHFIKELAASIMESLKKSTSSSDDVYDGASRMKDEAQEAYRGTILKMEETKESINNAMVSLDKLLQVNEMVSNILDISTQTNLLSINASIEAARAGESGRGFSVVAEEIGALAETSREMASKIQSICSGANDSIEVVKTCFDTILDFIESGVKGRFQLFASQSVEYSKAAEEIKSEVDEINGYMNELERAFGQIADSINNVQDISNENKDAIDIITQKSEITANIAQNVQKQSEDNQKLAVQLESMVDRFFVE